MTFPVTPARNSSWIATQALSRIGAASVDNPASAEDLALALDRLDVVASNLQGRGVLYVADLDTTPAGIAHELANALALALQPDFGDATPPGQGALPAQAQIDANLKRITADLVSYGPQQTSFF
jgi:hypothetical protein